MITPTRTARRFGHTRRFGLFVCLAAFTATAAFAQAADPGRGEQMQAKLQKRFAAADTNGDGKLSKEEAKNGMPFVYKHFDEIDTAKSGSITMAEIVAFAKAERAARKATP
jgi:hypothetical protein